MMSRSLIITLIFCLPVGSSLLAQKAGCTDPLAINFDSSATANNGSCLYAVTSYAPPLVAVLPSVMAEVSGVVYWNGKLVMLNDGGNGNRLFIADTLTGKIQQVLVLEGATNHDWEDLAQDSTYFYVGDFGNNASGNRKDLTIYKFAKAVIGKGDTVVISAADIGRIRFSYEDQADFSPTNANQTRYDCESMIYLRGKLHLFTKNWLGTHTVHYTVAADTGTFAAIRLDSMNTGNYKITGAASGGYDEIAFTSYSTTGACALFLVFGFDSSAYFLSTGNRRRFNLPSAISMGQLEGICFFNATRGWMTSERLSQSLVTINQRFRRFNVLGFIKDYYIQNPALLAEEGMLRYNSTEGRYEVFSGLKWEFLGM